MLAPHHYRQFSGNPNYEIAMRTPHPVQMGSGGFIIEGDWWVVDDGKPTSWFIYWSSSTSAAFLPNEIPVTSNSYESIAWTHTGVLTFKSSTFTDPQVRFLPCTPIGMVNRVMVQKNLTSVVIRFPDCHQEVAFSSANMVGHDEPIYVYTGAYDNGGDLTRSVDSFAWFSVRNNPLNEVEAHRTVTTNNRWQVWQFAVVASPGINNTITYDVNGSVIEESLDMQIAWDGKDYTDVVENPVLLHDVPKVYTIQPTRLIYSAVGDPSVTIHGDKFVNTSTIWAVLGPAEPAPCAFISSKELVCTANPVPSSLVARWASDDVLLSFTGTQDWITFPNAGFGYYYLAEMRVPNPFVPVDAVVNDTSATTPDTPVSPLDLEYHFRFGSSEIPLGFLPVGISAATFNDTRLVLVSKTNETSRILLPTFFSLSAGIRIVVRFRLPHNLSLGEHNMQLYYSSPPCSNVETIHSMTAFNVTYQDIIINSTTNETRSVVISNTSYLVNTTLTESICTFVPWEEDLRNLFVYSADEWTVSPHSGPFLSIKRVSESTATRIGFRSSAFNSRYLSSDPDPSLISFHLLERLDRTLNVSSWSNTPKRASSSKAKSELLGHFEQNILLDRDDFENDIPSLFDTRARVGELQWTYSAKQMVRIKRSLSLRAVDCPHDLLPPISAGLYLAFVSYFLMFMI